MANSTNREVIYKVAGVLAGVALILGGKACFGRKTGPGAAKAQAALTGLAQIMDAVTNRRTGITVQHWGTVERTMSDDQGAAGKLQKFVLALENRHTLLVAHDVDVAPRVPLAIGDRVEFRGRYDWNGAGGLIYRTHHDPQMIFEDGWIRHNGKVYR
jgi:hypothetical protein